MQAGRRPKLLMPRRERLLSRWPRSGGSHAVNLRPLPAQTVVCTRMPSSPTHSLLGHAQLLGADEVESRVTNTAVDHPSSGHIPAGPGLRGWTATPGSGKKRSAQQPVDVAANLMVPFFRCRPGRSCRDAFGCEHPRLPYRTVKLCNLERCNQGFQLITITCPVDLPIYALHKVFRRGSRYLRNNHTNDCMRIRDTAKRVKDHATHWMDRVDALSRNAGNECPLRHRCQTRNIRYDA